MNPDTTVGVYFSSVNYAYITQNDEEYLMCISGGII